MLEEKGRKFAQGYNFYKIFWVFLIGSAAGDLIETVFCRVALGSWMSRSSVIYGHFSVIWGFGAVILTVLLHGLQGKRDAYVFFAGTVLGGMYEYLCSFAAEKVFGVTFWDYSKLPLNVNGRINLPYCLFWGIVAVAWVKEIYPRLSGLIERIPAQMGKSLSWVLVVLMTANMAVSASALARSLERQQNPECSSAYEAFLDRHYPDEVLKAVYPKMKFVDGT
ncbi:MAG: putative ABC transporter permease [Eubacteriales bacterium]|nr:putative ABC transporter permease [Eubacteriales bacterium]